jgi:AI-2 transport protein TqsA
MDAIPQRASLARVLFILAAAVVVLVGVRLSAPVLNPILFAIVFALLFAPVYGWLQRRLPAGVALLLSFVALLIIIMGLFVLLSASISRFTGRLSFYAQQLDAQLADLQELLDRLGLSGVDLSEAVNTSALVEAIGAVLSGISGFLSSLFLILMIMLFLLGESSAMMERLRTSVAHDNPQVARLTVIGQSVALSFGLRAIVNLVTALGITLVLWLLGVDFPILWGVLVFFLSFIPYIGLILAVAPAVVLALAEFGLGRAIIVIVAVVVINVLAENVLSPVLMGRGLELSPTVVFLSFIFWAWLLGGPGAFLALPLTLFVAIMLGSFPETRWLASLMGLPDTALVASAAED